MKGGNCMVKWFEEAPFWLKVIFALPLLDIVWGVFRIVKGATKGDNGLIAIGVVWVILGGPILWIVDMVSIIIKKHPIWA